MFKRHDMTTKNLLRKRFLASQLFCDMYPSLRYVKDDLSPTEIWSEAIRVVKNFALSPRPVLELEATQEELQQLYSSFLDDSGKEVKRNEEQAKTSVFLVLFTALYIVACAGTSSEHHPHRELCLALADATYSHPLREELWRSIRQTEDEEEKTGRRIETFDLILQTTAEESNHDATENSNIEFVNSWVDEVVKMKDQSSYTQAEKALSRINDRDGHIYDEPLTRLRRESDNLSKAMNIEGDYVVEKKVENEIKHVEAGGIGVNVVKNEKDKQ